MDMINHWETELEILKAIISKTALIETVKREETKLSRIEKIKPMILDDIRLNDKYRERNFKLQLQNPKFQ